MLTENQLRAVLGSRPFRFYPQVDSTNDLAQAWLIEGAPQGAAVIADEQMAGRGRKGRVWHTPPGVAIAVSVILSPSPEAIGQVTMIGAVAIAEALEALGAPKIGIKWANDVLLNGKKVSGVLSEAVWQGDQLRGVILGMGINVRVQFDGTDLADSAISVETALKRPIDRAELLGHVLNRVDAWTQQGGVFEAWRDRLVTIGQWVRVTQDDRVIEGQAQGVEESGALRIETADGLQRVFAGDLHLGG
ncbi:MAG: biotin--[acetyl-CoA-carboxylase] ligase [Anaerolineae bacterium]|jgi:BirA family biotin operon repressor/biotin-[acetyl-CoA-carboxylase] ligase|nr:biotin--[acetyl-CoA-carboxylase] ligase [Anaerolineae bacterium]